MVTHMDILRLILDRIKPPITHLQSTMIISLLALSISIILAFAYLQVLSKEKIQDFTLDSAKLYIETLTKVRTLYTSEVVDRVTKNGIIASHEYLKHVNAIPLPATFSMLLGNAVNVPGINTRLYSAFPFPNDTATRGLTDDFSKRAWSALNDNPNKDYYSFEEINGIESLRYASADIMRDGCADCHNSHPDTPFNQWKTGDVRGVLEVIVPLAKTANAIDQLIKQTFLVVLLTCLLISAAIYIVVKRLKFILLATKSSSSKVLRINAQLQQKIEQDKLLQEKLMDISFTDALTGIANRRYFDQELDKQWHWAIRKKCQLAVIMFDIDYFKPYNDNYGHPQGDVALKLVAQAMKESQLRPFDIVCRYGGEEFVLILCETEQTGALIVAERIRIAIETLAIEHQYSPLAPMLTVSAGVGTMYPTPDSSPEDLISLADQALYQAKENGRNRTEALNINVEVI